MGERRPMAPGTQKQEFVYVGSNTHIHTLGVKRLVRIFEYSFENFKRASIRNFALDRFFKYFFRIGIVFF